MYNLEINSERWLDLTNFPNEEWEYIRGFENLYQISNFGRVKSFNKRKSKFGKILRARVDKKGYIHYALKKNKIAKELKAHRLVAQTFIKNEDNKPQVNHIDGNKINNYYKNLEWCTNSENQKHSYVINPERGNIFKSNNPRKKNLQ